MIRISTESEMSNGNTRITLRDYPKPCSKKMSEFVAAIECTPAYLEWFRAVIETCAEEREPTP